MQRRGHKRDAQCWNAGEIFHQLYILYCPNTQNLSPTKSMVKNTQLQLVWDTVSMYQRNICGVSTIYRNIILSTCGILLFVWTFCIINSKWVSRGFKGKKQEGKKRPKRKFRVAFGRSHHDETGRNYNRIPFLDPIMGREVPRTRGTCTLSYICVC